MKESQARGLTHWMLYTDSKSLYAYDLVAGKSKAVSVLDKLSRKVSYMAVDSNHGYLFVAMQSENDDDKDTVDRYSFKVDASGKTASLTIDEATKVQVYKGKFIGGITVDDDQSILYVAETSDKRIDSISYTPKVLEVSNSEIGLTSTIYKGLSGLNHVTSLTVDYLGNILWSTSKDGQSKGAIK